MNRLILALAAMLVAEPALALSCMRPDPVSDFRAAASAPEPWIVVEGMLTFGPLQKPAPGKSGGAKVAETPGHITGAFLTRNGFTGRFNRDITLRVSCVGPWCGTITPGRHLAFLKQEGDRYVMLVEACPSKIYENPDPATLDAIERCMSGKCP